MKMEEKQYIGLWVKTRVSQSAWSSYYSKDNYCYLSKNDDGVWIGCLIMKDNFIEGKHYKLTDREILQVDEYCRMRNLLPSPISSTDRGKAIQKKKERPTTIEF